MTMTIMSNNDQQKKRNALHSEKPCHNNNDTSSRRRFNNDTTSTVGLEVELEDMLYHYGDLNEPDHLEIAPDDIIQAHNTQKDKMTTWQIVLATTRNTRDMQRH